MLTTIKQAKQDLQDTKEMVENQGLLGKFLSNLIYFVHVGDIEKTEADWLNLGHHWRDRSIEKTLESCKMHVARCEPCRKRLKYLRDKRLDIERWTKN